MTDNDFVSLIGFKGDSAEFLLRSGEIARFTDRQIGAIIEQSKMMGGNMTDYEALMWAKDAIKDHCEALHEKRHD